MKNLTKKPKRAEYFDWSRYPSREGVYKVFLGDPYAYATFGKDITKVELADSLAIYDRITALEQKKVFLRDALYVTVMSIPFLIFIHNFLTGITR